jgi:hypothetical protein
MSSAQNKGGGRNFNLRYVWIIASVVALGVVLSPASPFSLQSITTSPVDQAAQSNTLTEQEELSDLELPQCGPVAVDVEFIISGEASGTEEEDGEGEIIDDTLTDTGLTPFEKLASDTLIREFCNEPRQLVRQINSAYDPSLVLVAYGCDVAAGKIGDRDIQDSLRNYTQVYCESAKETIEYESDFLIQSAQGFKMDTLPLLWELIESQDNGGNSSGVLQNAESVLDLTIETINNSTELLSKGSTYQAALSLDEANKMYAGMIENEEMTVLLALRDEEPEEEDITEEDI